MMRGMRLPMRLQIRARLTSGITSGKLPTWPHHLLPTTCFDDDSIVGNDDEGDAMRLQIWTRLTSGITSYLKLPTWPHLLPTTCSASLPQFHLAHSFTLSTFK